jgi:hypothetical protein
MRVDSSPPMAAQTLTITSNSSYLSVAVLGQATVGAMRVQEGAIDMPVKTDYIAMQVRSSATAGAAWELDSITYEFLEGGKRRQS